jgi:hypothetical protein
MYAKGVVIMQDQPHKHAGEYAVALLVASIVIPLALAVVSQVTDHDLGLAAIVLAGLLALCAVGFGVASRSSPGGKAGLIGGSTVMGAVFLVVLWCTPGTGGTRGSGQATPLSADGGTVSGGTLQVAVPATSPSQTQPALSVVPAVDPLLGELEPDRSHFVLKCAGRELSFISVEDGEVVEMLIMNQDGTRQIVLSARDQMFPGKMSVSVHPASDPYQPITTTMDDDLDGVPEGQMRWDEKQRYDLDSIEWRPAKRDADHEVTTLPESAPSAS